MISVMLFMISLTSIFIHFFNMTALYSIMIPDWISHHQLNKLAMSFVFWLFYTQLQGGRYMNIQNTDSYGPEKAYRPDKIFINSTCCSTNLYR